MPIDIDRFKDAAERELRAQRDDVTNAERILAFLTARSEQAFMPKEIREAADLPRGSVGVVLSRLEESGHVLHRGEYWAIDDEERGERALSAVRTARAATERFGPEDPDEWEIPNGSDQE